ncbi:family 78 glycoside hydrolase catalytic domain [Parafrigoribacterium soli]|uniref:family 78 glycoside hydrolase catalytic domain n=1 Tax=Parafrigoribacterium soli TaxID=3144663 RepID=UPI0032EC6FCA
MVPTAVSQPLSDAMFVTADAPTEAAVRIWRDVALDRPRSQIRSARLTATAHGIYEATIDGRSVTDSVLNPGWTAYEWRLQYQEFDVTDLLASGEGRARIALVLGNGWYRGGLGFARANANYGDELAAAAALRVVFEDGHMQNVVTDQTWVAELSETVRNSLYNGQTIDARLRGGAKEPLQLRVTEVDRGTLTSTMSPPILRHEHLRPVEIITTPSGRSILDFGQNLVGWLALRVRGNAGDRITIRHAEVLEDGELGTRPLRGADSTDVFVLSGGDDEFEPTFTFHGFRYAEVQGWPGDIRDADIEAVVVHSQMKRTGYFRCSEPLVNRLIENSVWGQKGNFLSVPTDCPQRDERLGWTGDIAAYAASASFQFDTSDFLDSWLRDLLAETSHTKDHVVPLVVPDVLKYARFPDGFSLPWHRATAVWGDASVWVPEALWHAYGDVERLRGHYPAMVRHLDSIAQDISPTGVWDLGNQLGDWLDPDAPPDDPAAAKADPSVVATACLFRSATFAAEAAAEIGESDDAARWLALAGRTRRAFNEHYVDHGVVQSDCATVYALAIVFGLLDADDRQAAGDRLAYLVRVNEYKVTTGFAGTPFVTWALSETGHIDDAYRLLLERGCPSWLYPVTMGATTIWERWDSMLPDGSINAGEMTSFNHYALGAVADWIYQVVGGIRPGSPGYAEVVFRPQPGPGITWADSSYESVHGRIECSWRMAGNRFHIEVSTPDGIPAHVILPDGESVAVRGGRHALSCAWPPDSSATAGAHADHPS